MRRARRAARGARVRAAGARRRLSCFMSLRESWGKRMIITHCRVLWFFSINYLGTSPRKASGSTEGAPRSSHWDPRPLARRHRRVPLAGARRTPRAPTGRPRHYRARATSSGVPSYAKKNVKPSKCARWPVRSSQRTAHDSRDSNKKEDRARATLHAHASALLSAQRSRALAIYVRGRRASPYLAAYLALLVDPLLAVARPVDDLVRVRARWVRC